MTAKGFGQALYKLRPNIEEKQRMACGRLQWCYIGIGVVQHEIDSHHSRDSRDSPLSSTQAREEQHSANEQGGVKKIRGNPVNPVNPVNDPTNCFHDWVDTSNDDGRLKRTCRLCGEFYGYV